LESLWKLALSSLKKYKFIDGEVLIHREVTQGGVSIGSGIGWDSEPSLEQPNARDD